MANEKFLDLSTLQTGLERYDDSLADVAKSGDYDDLSNPPAFELPKTDEYISLEVTGSKYIAYNQQEDFNMLMNCMMECYDSDIKNRDAIVLKINDDEYTGTNTIGYSVATWTFPDANLKATLSNISRPIPEGALSIAVNPQIDFEMIDQSGDSTVYDAIQVGDIVQFPIPPIVYTAIVNTEKLNELQESVSYNINDISSLLATALGVTVQFANLHKFGKFVCLDVRFDTSSTELSIQIDTSNFMPPAIAQAVGTIVGVNGTMLGTVLKQGNALVFRTNTSTGGNYADLHLSYFTN